MTSNPTIFQAAIAEGDAYDDQLREVLKDERDPKEVFLAARARGHPRRLRHPAQEVRRRHRRLRLARGRPDARPRHRRHEGRGAPAVRHDRAPEPAGEDPGHRGRACRAIEDTIADGIPVNVTLIFSLERHRAGGRGLHPRPQRLKDNGGDLSKVASVASFFVSRVDSEADKRLDEVGGHDELKGTLAIANAKLAYQTYKEIFAGAEWDELAAAGATPQRCLWASTSTKNPEYRDVMYVEELVGPDTVDTMPRETVEATLDHGEIRRTLDEDVDGARKTLEAFEEAGIDYDDVVAVLEREGVEKFAKSFKDLLDGIAAKRDDLVAA